MVSVKAIPMKVTGIAPDLTSERDLLRKLIKRTNNKSNIVMPAMKEAQKRCDYATLPVMPAESDELRGPLRL